MGGTEIRQLLTYNQHQAIKNANAPTGSNPFLTSADVVALSGSSELPLYPVAAAIPYTIPAGIPPFPVFNLVTYNYPVNPAIVPGRSRKMRFVTQFSKGGVPATSINFIFQIGGLTLTLPTQNFPGAIGNRNLIFDIDITFGLTSDLRATATLHEYVGLTTLDTCVATASGVGVWDLGLPNTFQFNIQALTGTVGATHTFAILQRTSILI